MKSKHSMLLKAVLLGALLWTIAPHGATAGTNVWTPIGPGGTIVDLAIDPQNPSTLYAVGKAVLKSIDGGSRWFNIGADLSAFKVTTIVIDPRTKNTLYAGTQENGIYKSTDGGQSFRPANTGLTGSLRVNALVVDPRTPAIAYVSLYGGGVYKSTDGGVSWTPSNSGMSDFQPSCFYCRNVTSLAIDPTAPTILYAGTQSGAIFKSTDGGALWTLIASIFDFGSISAFVIDHRNPDVLYANAWCGGIFKSIDGGRTWNRTVLSQNGCYGALVRYFVGDSRTTTLYALTSGGTTLLRSTDGAATWGDVGGKRPLMMTLAIDPEDSSTLYAGLWQEGVLKSTDAGGHWLPVNSGLTRLGLYDLTVDPETPATIYGLTWNTPFKSTDGGDTWRPAVTGLRSNHVFFLRDHTPTTLYLAGRDPNGIYKSTDGAESWRALDLFISFGRSIVTLIIDRQTPTTLYAATSTDIEHWGSVYKTTDGGETWVALWSGEGVTSLSLGRSDPTTLYVMDWRGGVFKSTDGGSSWSASTWPSPNPRKLAGDPRTPTTLYTWDDGLYKSTDGGITWDATGAELPDLLVAGLFIDPVTTSTLYLTSRGNGIFKSTDGGDTWTAFSDGLTGTSARNVSYLVFDPRTPSTIHAQTSEGIFIISAPTLVLDPTIDFSSPEGRGSGVVQWKTDQERDLNGFHIVTIVKSGLRTQINPALIACQGCATGSAGDYAYIVPKHRSGHDLFIEEVYRDDHVELFALTRQK